MKIQFWSMDLIFAVVIFSGAIILLSVIWFSVNNQFAVTYGYGISNMQAQLSSLVQRLQSTGSPPGWNQGTVAIQYNASIGLGNSNGTISKDKLAALLGLANSNYTQTKQLLGVAYDYYIVVSSSQYNISIGKNPSIRNATAIQTTSLPIVLDNGYAANMRITVWTNTSFGVG